VFFDRHEKNGVYSVSAKEWFEKGESFTEKKEYDSAVTAYTSAISLDPNYEDAFISRAKAFFNKRQIDKAIEDCTKVVSINPNNGAGFFIRGLMLPLKKQHAEAITDFSNAIKLKYNLEVAYENRGKSHVSLEEYDNAIADYSAVIAIAPDNMDVYSLRGNAYLLVGAFKEAIQDFNKIIAVNPKEASALGSRGCAYALSGANEKAIPDLKTACDLGDEAACMMLQEISSTQTKNDRNEYRLSKFIINNEISISPEIQENEKFPFTMDCAQKFFANFVNLSFNFDRPITSIIIYDAKENLPRHSYAHGFLYSQSLDEIGEMATMPKPIGTIHFEYGGNLTTPVIKLERH
jgi:Flp pilus assembly protein TadD